MTFSSKDFHLTQSQLTVNKNNKLIHKQVIGSSTVTSFDRERKHPVHIVDLPSNTISMTIGGLLVGQQTNRHRHTYETVIYIQQGSGTSIIEDEEVKWQAGDAIYIPVWAWHSHRNDGQEECIYIACENTPLLQNLNVAIREESE